MLFKMTLFRTMIWLVRAHEPFVTQTVSSEVAASTAPWMLVAAVSQLVYGYSLAVFVHVPGGRT